MEYKKQELIDTQWDVNINLDIQLNGSSDELIDTQWDVNKKLFDKKMGR